MKTGMIRQLFERKNHGFISCKGDKNSYFFHRDDFVGHWTDLLSDFESRTEPILVTFEEGTTEKGPRARNVRRVGFPNEA